MMAVTRPVILSDEERFSGERGERREGERREGKAKRGRKGGGGGGGGWERERGGGGGGGGGGGPEGSHLLKGGRGGEGREEGGEGAPSGKEGRRFQRISVSPQKLPEVCTAGYDSFRYSTEPGSPAVAEVTRRAA